MAVFYDTGGGDIYGGPNKEDVIKAMQDDSDDFNLDDIEEVSGAHLMMLSDENGESSGEMITIEAEYDETFGSYCVCSYNL